MTQYVDAEALLADIRRKRERTDELAHRPRLKLGVQTTTRRKLRPISAERGRWGGSSPARARRKSSRTRASSGTSRTSTRCAHTCATQGGAASICRAERRSGSYKEGRGDSAMNGYERPSLVRAALEGLKRERQGTSDPRRLAQIEAQEVLFEAELARMEREGIMDEVEPGHPALGTISYVGKAGRGRIIV